MSLAATLMLAAAALSGVELDVLREQVRGAECAFARSMAERNLAAFGRFVAEDTVFFAPGMRRGRAEVLAGWARWFEGPQAPFSWAPQQVELLADGSLAYSTGLIAALVSSVALLSRSRFYRNLAVEEERDDDQDGIPDVYQRPGAPSG